MKNYLDLLEEINLYGDDHEDRTGVGRRSIFSTSLRFNMNDGFPLVTTRKISLNALVEETIWFLRGHNNVNLLNNKGVTIWDKWVLRKEHFKEFLINKFNNITEEEINTILEQNDDIIDTIGPLYGVSWRKLPGLYEIDQIPSTLDVPDYHPDPDVMREIEIAITEQNKHLDEFKKELEDSNDEEMIRKIEELGGWDNFKENTLKLSKERFLRAAWYGITDQLANLIYNLKTRPFSARHVITAWIPEVLPIESMTPEENVIHHRQALAPCHILQIYHVTSPKNEGEKYRLNLQLTMRSNDVPIGTPYNIAQYALILHLVAQTVNMEANQLVLNCADSHIYHNQLDLIKEQLERQPKELPTLILDPKATVFNIQREHIKIEGYDPHPEIKYPVAK